MHLCFGAREAEAPGSQEQVLQAVVSCLTWVLGAELRLSKKAVFVLTSEPVNFQPLWHVLMIAGVLDVTKCSFVVSNFFYQCSLSHLGSIEVFWGYSSLLPEHSTYFLNGGVC